jgi:CheY-like chemotaxis protein
MSAAEPPLVLVAEDDPDILELIVACLESIGCDVVRALDGRSALRLAGAERPKLAVLDVRMPHLDGLRVTRLLKADPETSSIAVLVMTASVDGTQSEQARAAGADGYLAKPFTAAQLRDAARGLL